MAADTLLNRQASAVAGRLLLTEKEAAASMGCSTRTLFDLRKSGGLPYVLIGNRVCYTPGDLQSWIDARKQRATPAAT